MKAHLVFAFAFEGRNVCIFGDQLRDIRQSQSKDSGSNVYHINVNDIDEEVVLSTSPLLYESPEHGEMTRLVSRLQCQIVALQEALGRPYAHGPATLSVQSDDMDHAALLKELQMRKASILRLESLVDYQRREIARWQQKGVENVSSISQAPSGAVMKQKIVEEGEKSVLIEFSMESFVDDEDYQSSGLPGSSGTMKPSSSTSPSSPLVATSSTSTAERRQREEAVKKQQKKAAEDAKKQAEEAKRQEEKRRKKEEEDEKERKRIEAVEAKKKKKQLEDDKKAAAALAQRKAVEEEEERKKKAEAQRKLEEEEKKRTKLSRQSAKATGLASSSSHSSPTPSPSTSSYRSPEVMPVPAPRPPVSAEILAIQVLADWAGLVGHSSWSPEQVARGGLLSYYQQTDDNKRLYCQILVMLLVTLTEPISVDTELSTVTYPYSSSSTTAPGSTSAGQPESSTMTSSSASPSSSSSVVVLKPLDLQMWFFSTTKMILDFGSLYAMTLQNLSLFDSQQSELGTQWAPSRYRLLCHHYPPKVNFKLRMDAIHVAARFGALDFLLFCLKQLSPSSIHATDAEDCTVVHHAALKGHLHVLKAIKPMGAAFSAKSVGNRSPAHFAALGGHLHVLDWLAEEGMDLNSKDQAGYTPVDYAAAMGHLDIVRWLISPVGEEDLDLHVQSALVTVPSSHLSSLLNPDVHHSADTYLPQQQQQQPPPTAQQVKRKGGNITLPPSNPNQLHTIPSLVHLVTLHGDMELLTILKEKHDQNLSTLDSSGYSFWRPAHYACLSNQFELLQWLHRTGESLEDPPHTQISMMGLACTTGNMEMIRWLYTICKGNFKRDFVSYSKKNTLTHIAAKCGHLEVLNWLQEEGCPIFARNARGKSILHYGARSGNVELVKWILAQYVRRSKAYAQSEVHLEQSAGESQCAPLTFKDKSTHHGASIVHYGAKSGSVAMMEYLQREEGLDLLQFDGLGASISHYAFSSQSIPLLDWLNAQGILQRTAENRDHIKAKDKGLTKEVQEWLKRPAPSPSSLPSPLAKTSLADSVSASTPTPGDGALDSNTMGCVD